MSKAQFIIVIGASAGGSIVLPELIMQLDSMTNTSVFVVLHFSKRAIGDMLVKRIQKYTSLKCSIAAHNEVVKAGRIYVAKPDHHLLLKDDRILLGKGPMENRYRPSIDALFRSAAVTYGSHVIGIILSGMLEDGASGMQAIKRCGGYCIVQAPEDARYPDMPLSVLRNLKPDYSIPVGQMGNAISEIMKNWKPGKIKPPKDIAREAEIAESVTIGMNGLKDVGAPSLFSCPDCGGGLWEFKSNGITRYRCHVGHAFTEENLLGSMESSTESALWTALRIIEERKNLLRNIEEKERTQGKKQVGQHYKKRIRELESQIGHLKKVLFDTARD
jgi:two-component system, chemotaxis family, protein-glutamate methylesterase/glutaminase